MRDYGLIKVSDLKSMANSVRDLVGVSNTLTVSQMASYVREYQEAFTLNAFMNKTYSAPYIDFSLTYLAVNFNGQSKIPLISLPNLLSMAEGVNFGNCYNLSELNIPLCSTPINGIVANCSNLRKATLGQYYLSYPINDCYRLEELNIPRVSYIYTLFNEKASAYNSNLVVSAPNLEWMSNQYYAGSLYLPKFRRGVDEYRDQAFAYGKVLDCPVCVSLFSRNRVVNTNLTAGYYAEVINFPLMSFYYASLFAKNLSYFNCLYVSNLQIGDTKLSSITAYGNFSYGNWNDYSNPSMNSNLSTIKIYNQYFSWFASNNQAYAPCTGLESLYLYCSQVGITATHLVNTPIATSSYLGHYGSIYVPSYYWSYYSSRFSVLSRRLVSLTDEELECIPPYRYVNSTISFADISSLLSNKNTIGIWAFQGCSNLTSFSCSTITHVLDSAFYNCNNLSEINLPNAKYIGGEVFSNQALVSVTLGVQNFNVTRIALYSCPNLKYLRLNDMPFIEVSPSSVNNVTYPYPSLETLQLDKCSAIYTKLDIFSNISSFIAPSLKYLSGNLSNLSKLSILSLPDLASINTVYTINFPTNVEIINLPKLETPIYSMFTSNHIKLREVYLDRCPAISQYGFSGCYSLNLISIPNCKSISYGAFLNCSSLTSIDLPNVEYIGQYAFSGCSNLVRVGLSKCKTLEGYAIYNCSSLSDINLDMVEYIGQGALQNCPNLSSVNLTNCKTLSDNNFMGTQITELYLPECSTLGMLNGNIYSVYAPKLSSISAWSNLSYFRTDVSQFSTYTVKYVKEFVGSNLRNVPNFASSASATLISCTLGECHFSESAFYRIDTLQTFSGKILEMSGNGCFCRCNQLSSVDTRYVSRISYPKYGNIISWEYGAMWGCTTLTELKFINLEEVEDGNLFYGCSNLSTIYCLSKSVVTDMVPNPHWRSASGTMSVENVRCYESTPFSDIGTEAHFYVPEVLAQDYWRLCNNAVFRNKIEALPMSRVKEEYDLAGIPFPTEWLSLI